MDDITIVELGAGREEMAPYFAGWNYVPVDVGSGRFPENVRGVVFSNEFFDALPVDAVTMTSDGPRMLRVDWRQERFLWTVAEPAYEEYVRRYHPQAASGDRLEVAVAAQRWIERIAHALQTGFVVTIDYGYTTREALRFPQGTLMSYRRHVALEDVLTEPGERDITAHVHFTALEESADLERLRFETLAQTILGAGEEIVGELARSHPLQLKTLLFGMGETYRTLVQGARRD
jgi:SAM-dependent MidA family methyltransferase